METRYLHPSSLDLLAECEEAWRLAPDRDAGVEVSLGRAPDVGQAVHQAMEGWVRGDPLVALAGQLTDRWPEEVAAEAMGILGRWVEGKVAARLRDEIDGAMGWVLVEHRIEVPIVTPEQAKRHGFASAWTLRGRIDMVRDQPSMLRITDWKSHRDMSALPTPGTAPQLRLYAWGASKSLERPGPVAVDHVFLRYPNAGLRRDVLTADQVRRGRILAVNAIRRVEAMEAAQAHRARPGARCEHCQVAGRCRAAGAALVRLQGLQLVHPEEVEARVARFVADDPTGAASFAHLAGVLRTQILQRLRPVVDAMGPIELPAGDRQLDFGLTERFTISGRELMRVFCELGLPADTAWAALHGSTTSIRSAIRGFPKALQAQVWERLEEAGRRKASTALRFTKKASAKKGRR